MWEPQKTRRCKFKFLKICFFWKKRRSKKEERKKRINRQQWRKPTIYRWMSRAWPTRPFFSCWTCSCGTTPPLCLWKSCTTASETSLSRHKCCEPWEETSRACANSWPDTRRCSQWRATRFRPIAGAANCLAYRRRPSAICASPSNSSPRTTPRQTKLGILTRIKLFIRNL